MTCGHVEAGIVPTSDLQAALLRQVIAGGFTLERFGRAGALRLTGRGQHITVAALRNLSTYDLVTSIGRK